MNLTKLFEMQKVLKDRIGYNEEDKFEKMLLALIVEVGETANDWRKFKYWSQNQESKPTLLEEYVDGLHFVLESGLDLLEMGLIQKLPEQIEANNRIIELDIPGQFKQILWDVLHLEIAVINGESIDGTYKELFGDYLKLGHSLGFGVNQIIDAYMSKNEVNHKRQDSGY